MGHEILHRVETSEDTCSYPDPHPLERVLSDLARLEREWRLALSGEQIGLKSRQIARLWEQHGAEIAIAARKGLAST